MAYGLNRSIKTQTSTFIRFTRQGGIVGLIGWHCQPLIESNKNVFKRYFEKFLLDKIHSSLQVNILLNKHQNLHEHHHEVD